MPLTGSIRVPSDKSISHRSILFSGVAEGVSELQDVLPSADVLSSIGAMRALGAELHLEQGEHGLCGSVRGIGQFAQVKDPVEIDCGNSGTTTRLLLGLLAGLNVEAVLTGDASLSVRPMERVMEPLRALGARFESTEGHLPVRVLKNDGLHGQSIRTKQASAQVKSAILLAGLAADGTTQVTEPFQSRDHTELLLGAYGVDIKVDGLNSSVSGPVRLRSCDVSVPADPSSAAFIAVAAALTEGSDVLIKRVALNTTRTGAFEVLKRMGCVLEYTNTSLIGKEPVGDVHVRYVEDLSATVIEAGEIPALIDEIPILSLVAACAQGETVFRQCGELRVKESDRFAAIIAGLAAFGVEAFADGDDLHIVGRGCAPDMGKSRIELPTHHDHRLAMTWHIAGMCMNADVVLDDSACVAVSWPDFFEDIAALIS